ncbi:hypothetical protein X738_29900 [Mesorhizobium sp. LNHC209A00]|nr:hypothetical protein X738_29900 [Mesorhizobium sp. LNHC209A00]
MRSNEILLDHAPFPTIIGSVASFDLVRGQRTPFFVEDDDVNANGSLTIAIGESCGKKRLDTFTHANALK